MSEEFILGQKVVCIRNQYGYTDTLELGKVYTIKLIYEYDAPMMELEECPELNRLYSNRFIDATKYLHAKEFKNKLDNLIEMD